MDQRAGDEMSPASFIFLPILNLDPTDNTCLWSTRNYFVDYCERYRVIPFLTFDRRLWDKAFKMIQAAPDGHRVKKIKLILELFHVELSFVGAVGTLMEGSGLQEAQEQITAMVFSGKAQEMVFRAHRLAATALNLSWKWFFTRLRNGMKIRLNLSIGMMTLKMRLRKWMN